MTTDPTQPNQTNVQNVYGAGGGGKVDSALQVLKNLDADHNGKIASHEFGKAAQRHAMLLFPIFRLQVNSARTAFLTYIYLL